MLRQLGCLIKQQDHKVTPHPSLNTSTVTFDLQPGTIRHCALLSAMDGLFRVTVSQTNGDFLKTLYRNGKIYVED